MKPTRALAAFLTLLASTLLFVACNDPIQPNRNAGTVPPRLQDRDGSSTPSAQPERPSEMNPSADSYQDSGDWGIADGRGYPGDDEN